MKLGKDLDKYFNRFDYSKNIVLPYLYSLIHQRTGMCAFITGTTGSYKSTIVRATAEYYRSDGWSVLAPDTLKIKDMKHLADQINEIGKHRVVNLFLEDFSHVSEDYRLTRLAQFIGALSEDKRYVDYGNDIVIKKIKGLGFCGAVQPSWIRKLTQSTSWDTFYRQRFSRFYQLPLYPSLDPEQLVSEVGGGYVQKKVIEELVKNTKKYKKTGEFKECEPMKKAFKSQYGANTRALRNYRRFMIELDKWTPPGLCRDMAELMAGRMLVENDFVVRWYDREEKEFKSDINVGSVHSCFHVLDFNDENGKLTYDELTDRLDISRKTVSDFVKEASENGLIRKARNSNPTVRLESGSKLRKYVLGGFD